MTETRGDEEPEHPEDGTVVVPRRGAADDATVAVPRARANDDATVVASREIEDADATVVAPREAADADATVAASREAADADATVAAPRDLPAADATVYASRSKPRYELREPASEPEQHSTSRESSASIVDSKDPRLFRPPLDPRRRAPQPTFEVDGLAGDRTGVRPEIPVVYGARPDSYVRLGDGVVGSTIGAAPSDRVLEPVAERGDLPSLARQNRRFRLLVSAGGPVVLAGVAAGLWAIARFGFS